VPDSEKMPQKVVEVDPQLKGVTAFGQAAGLKIKIQSSRVR